MNSFKNENVISFEVSFLVVKLTDCFYQTVLMNEEMIFATIALYNYIFPVFRY